ncbi:hypothetical protein PV326_002862 [Microctonus aethiopoides]|nr:hypothetical protein PV326_002862 [Microctonus aethiopoides]
MFEKLYYRKDSTDRSELKNRWIKFTPELSTDSRLLVIDKHGHYINVVARLNYNNDEKFPCLAMIDLDKRTINTYPALPLEKITIEVFMMESGNYRWIKSSGGKVENNAVKGGIIENETVYVCRMKVDGHYSAGMMRPSTGTCEVLNAYQPRQDYELLIREE